MTNLTPHIPDQPDLWIELEVRARELFLLCLSDLADSSLFREWKRLVEEDPECSSCTSRRKAILKAAFFDQNGDKARAALEKMRLLTRLLDTIVDTIVDTAEEEIA